VVKHLHWVPHTLTPTQETECATLSIELLRQSGPLNTTVGSSLSPLTSHAFIFSTNHEQIWLCAEEPPETLRDTFQDPKMMMTIAWNPLKFHLLDALPMATI
jgi:hypothetical protein